MPAHRGMQLPLIKRPLKSTPELQVNWFWAVLVGEGQRCPGFAQVLLSDEVGAEHADKHVGPDSGFGVVVDGS